MEKKSGARDIILMVLAVLIVIGVVIGLTYAFWKTTIDQENPTDFVVSCLDVSFTDGKNDIDLDDIYPVSDDEGRNYDPYTFTLTNNCKQPVNYTVYLETLKDTTLSRGSLAAVLDNDPTKVISAYTPAPESKKVDKTSLDSYIIKEGEIEASTDNNNKKSVTHNLRIWMPSTVSDDEAMSKLYEGKIVVEAYIKGSK